MSTLPLPVPAPALLAARRAGDHRRLQRVRELLRRPAAARDGEPAPRDHERAARDRARAVGRALGRRGTGAAAR
ncbi:hypothetical protein [Patulibacter sp. SYSU D01012]|uniref:hypothetical protein n=1 Tax=Patulibacter sp. SYSU D01012 TaxID=2817381 RepID=UPI001B300ED9|nr:hypothetical protein [Patulibacter sp. SYSU D01012]